MSSICDDLRAAILQAAMQGKLTERSETDDSSERIKEQIIAERSRYKNCKFLDNSNDSVDFPDEWQSLKTGEVFELLIGEKVVSGNKLPLLDAKYFRGKQKSFTDKGNLANKDDVLILVDGENSGETFLCTESGYMGSTFKALFIPKCLNKDFALYFLEMNRKVLRDNKRGSAIPHLDKKLFFNFIFPIPSLAEQKRIVEKVDELMARVADLEQSADALASLKKAFPDDIKASLLQAAMQGKLTEQLPEDGDAEELLDQIKAEKERLIAEGKIKKQKPLAPIIDDEIPFSIPENWKWERFGNLGSYRKGPFGSALTKSIFVEDSANAIKVYEQKNAIKKDASLGDYYISREYYEDKMKNFRVLPGDIIVSCAGTIGETYILPEGIREGIINQALMRMRMFNGIYIPYFLIYFDYIIKTSAISNSKGSAIKNIPPFEVLYMYPVAIPPLAEQKRIVERLDILMQNINVVGELIAGE